MKKRLLIITIILLSFVNVVFAETTNMITVKEEDILAILGLENNDKINIFFFYGNGCPHCDDEKEFLKELEVHYQDKISIHRYEVWSNESNKNKLFEIKGLFGETRNSSVPFTVMSTSSYTGFSAAIGRRIERDIKEILNPGTQENPKEDNKENIPFLGEIDAKKTSVTLIAIILGFVDGFNPCAMWVLLFLLNMLLGMKDKKKMLLIGSVFLFTSSVVYFFSMLGITTVLSYLQVNKVRSVIGVVAIIFGIISIYKYHKAKKLDEGCIVIDEKKRRKVFKKIQKFITEKNMFLALGGVIALAISVNIVELACSTVFPATFAEILAINEITGMSKIMYLLIYTLFYMIDDLIVFFIAVFTLSVVTTSSKFSKLSNLIGGSIMFLMGILLIFKPEWIMFNF